MSDDEPIIEESEVERLRLAAEQDQLDGGEEGIWEAIKGGRLRPEAIDAWAARSNNHMRRCVVWIEENSSTQYPEEMRREAEEMMAPREQLLVTSADETLARYRAYRAAYLEQHGGQLPALDFSDPVIPPERKRLGELRSEAIVALARLIYSRGVPILDAHSEAQKHIREGDQA